MTILLNETASSCWGSRSNSPEECLIAHMLFQWQGCQPTHECVYVCMCVCVCVVYGHTPAHRPKTCIPRGRYIRLYISIYIYICMYIYIYVHVYTFCFPPKLVFLRLAVGYDTTHQFWCKKIQIRKKILHTPKAPQEP